MDARILLLLFAALFGGAVFVGQQDLILGNGSSEAKPRPQGTGGGVDARHDQIRRTLTREGFDLNDPDSFVREVDGRMVVGGRVAATEHLRTVFIDKIMDSYARPVVTETPARPTLLEPVENCGFSLPEPGARVANVFSNATLERVSFHAFSKAELDIAARTDPKYFRHLSPAVDSQEPTGMTFARSAPERGSEPFWQVIQYTVMEVVVTETERPVHLVLQSGNGRVLWNIHLADDARLSGVSLLGGYYPAVANVPRSVPVEIMGSALMRRCGIERARLPLATDPIFTAIDKGEVPKERVRAGLEDLNSRVDRWNAWFAAQFGVRSDETRIGHDEAAIMAVVGPVDISPEDRVSYRSLKKARVSMEHVDHVMTRQPLRATAAIKKLVQARIDELAQSAQVDVN